MTVVTTLRSCMVWLAFVVFGLCVHGCFCNNESMYHFGLVPDADFQLHYRGIEWSSSNVGMRNDDDAVRVYLPRGIVPELEMIEVFNEAGPLEIAGVLRNDLSDSDGCGANSVSYDLSSLPNGEYLVVHRRSSAPPGLTTFDDQWTEFEGEEALVTVLVRRFGP